MRINVGAGNQPGRSRNERGSAVIVVMVLIGIVLMYIAANLKSLAYLNQELKLVEKRQVQRLNGATNSVSMKTVQFQRPREAQGQ